MSQTAWSLVPDRSPRGGTTQSNDQLDYELCRHQGRVPTDSRPLDHSYLNDIDDLCNPTSEHLVRWIWQRLTLSLLALSKVVVRETCTTGCVYRAE